MIPAYTLIAISIIRVIVTVLDFYHAHLVVVFNVAILADLFALAASFSIHFTVCDLRTAHVVSHFNVQFLAVAACT